MTHSLPIIDQRTTSPDAPHVPLRALDTVWFQVAGTICNLRCHHCFISCSPENDKFAFMSLQTCARFLEESEGLGVKEYYFTGGEPFANPSMCDILEITLLNYGPATVLTNATLLHEKTLRRLTKMATESRYALELRVSLDGYTAEMNDPVRGEGTFARTVEGIAKLVAAGFQPIITITRTWDGDSGEGCEGDGRDGHSRDAQDRDSEVLSGFVDTLKSLGYDQPRIKVLPLLKMGAETARGGGYAKDTAVTHEMMSSYDSAQLLCSSARLVTDQGVWVCPILLDAPDARMGETLAVTMGPYPLRHAACYTCWQYGAICSNESSACSATTDATTDA